MSGILLLLLVLAGVVVAHRYWTRTSDNLSPNVESVPGPIPRAVNVLGAAKAEASIKSQHAAAITAAILTATRGRGRILNVVPQPQQSGSIFSDSTRRWRTAAIVASVGRRLPPTWKR